MTLSRSHARQMPRNRAECVARGGRESMEMVRHQSPEWADEIKRRALILIEQQNNNERRAA